jgi:hypothetical protein
MQMTTDTTHSPILGPMSGGHNPAALPILIPQRRQAALFYQS